MTKADRNEIISLILYHNEVAKNCKLYRAPSIQILEEQTVKHLERLLNSK